MKMQHHIYWKISKVTVLTIIISLVILLGQSNHLAFAQQDGEQESPTVEPTTEPTQEPIAEPTEAPIIEPTAEPTEASIPTQEPIAEPTEVTPVIDPIELPEPESISEPEIDTTDVVPASIDIYDLSYVASRYGSNDAGADMNFDGKVDIFDLTLLASKYNQPPEPDIYDPIIAEPPPFDPSIDELSPEISIQTVNEPGNVPSDVGNWEDARNFCKDLTAPIPYIELIGFLGNRMCDRSLDKLDKYFTQAYRETEREKVSPGYPNDDIYHWGKYNLLIQEFSYGTLGDGAIMMRSRKATVPPKYVGGWAWDAFMRAINKYNVYPGYPINTQHTWNKVQLVDFREGSWGDGAIILNRSRKSAELVTGRHWKAYIKANGSMRLGAPKTFVNLRDGWYVQTFEGGEIKELAGIVWVHFNDNNSDKKYIGLLTT